MDEKNTCKADAVAEGEKVLRMMDHALEQLGRAGRFGMLEMFAGSFLTGARKSSQISEAKRLMKNIRDAMEIFTGMLDHQWLSPEQQSSLREFIGYADYFLNKPIADWAARTKIDDARIQMRIARDRLCNILAQLRN